MKPVEASKLENESTVYKNLYPEKEEKIKNLHSKLEIE